jgi:hypothetical protein
MKNIIVAISCFLILGITQKALADYNKCELKLKITLVNGKDIEVFTQSPGYFELDSISSLVYLTKILIQGNVINEGLFFGFEKRYICADMYVYFKSIKIPLDRIQSYEIVEVSNDSYLVQMLTDIELSDTSWFTKEPIEKIDLTGGEFEYTFFIYERNKQLDSIIAEFKSEYKKIFKNTNISYYEYFNNLIKSMKGKKVIVSSFGSGC